MDVKNNIAVRTIRDTAQGFAEIAKEVWGFVGHPSQWRPRMEAAKARRQDIALQTKLNRDIRQQFIAAFNRSAQKKMTVETAQVLRQYKARNGYISALLRPYEKYSNWRLSAKVVGAAVFFRAARRALYPLMGAWGMIVPLAAFVGARMAIVYRDAKNKQQEAQLARDGMIVPCTFEVKNQKVSVLGRELTADFTLGFPVMYRETPEWVVAKYDALKKALEKPEALHAAGFEALRAGTLDWSGIAKIRAAFPEQEEKQACVYAFSLLFQDKPLDALIADVQELAKQQGLRPKAVPADHGLAATFRRMKAKPEDNSMAATVLRVLGPFCVAGKEADGISTLAGRVTGDDLHFLSALAAIDGAPSSAQAKEIFRMIHDPRFADLTFRDMTLVALAPPQAASAFDDLWKDREYRARFDFDFLRDVAFNMQSWGATALRLTRHEYSKSLSTDDIRELAAPENETWAPLYHRLRVAQPALTRDMTHAEVKSLVQEYGIKAEETLTAPKVVSLRAVPIKPGVLAV